MTLAAVLLAAGKSSRFGKENKLLAPLGGRPLVEHAASALKDAGADILLAVAGSDAVASALPEFETLAGDAFQSGSLQAGIREAQARGATSLLIALGDMPLVTPKLLRAVVAHHDADHTGCAWDGARPMPPACFPRSLFAELLSLEGDAGARTVLRDVAPEFRVSAASGELADVDTVHDLERVTRLWHAKCAQA